MMPDQEVRENYRKASEDVAYLKKLDEYDLNQVYRYAEGCWQEHHKRAVAIYLANVDYNYPEEYRGNEIDYWLDHEWQTQKCKRVIQEIERLRELERFRALFPPTPADQLSKIAKLVQQGKITMNQSPMLETIDKMFSLVRVPSILNATTPPPLENATTVKSEIVSLTPSTEKSTSKRGPYRNSKKEQAIGYYESEVRDAIEKMIRQGKVIDKAKIERPILEKIMNNKGYNERTLRGHLSASLRMKLFGEIHRQVLELKAAKNQ